MTPAPAENVFSEAPGRLTDAQRQMAEDNIAVVYAVLRENRLYRSTEEARDDRLSQAFTIFVRAAARWRPTHGSGAKFSTYAFSCLRTGLLSPPDRRVGRVKTVRLDREVDGGLHGAEFEDMLPWCAETDDRWATHDRREYDEEYCRRALAVISGQHRDILELLCGFRGPADGTSGRSLAAASGVSYQAVSQKAKVGLKRIRKAIQRGEGPGEYDPPAVRRPARNRRQVVAADDTSPGQDNLVRAIEDARAFDIYA